ncbi:MAG TPA: 2'-5' RNA ligase family protein [Rhizomicrobium sp.]|nr:2'-5' RNA ligase family protein [Rhizomicrobium sp.]
MPPKPRRKFGPSQKDRIFFACLPDAETAVRIHTLAVQLKETHGFTGNLILPEHLHVTLFHLGDWQVLPQEIVKIALDAAATVQAAPFEVTFDKTRSFPNRTGIFPFVLNGPVAAWNPLLGTLAGTLKKAGLGGATKGEFEPHVTLTYDKLRLKAAKVAPPITWTVRDFVLVHSQLGKTTHTHLGRWPLQKD